MRKIFLVMTVLLTVTALFAGGLAVESADTVAAGKIKVVLSGDMGFFSKYYNDDGNYTDFTGNVAKTSIAIPLCVKYGLGDKMELGLDTSFVIDSFTLVSGTKLSGSGFGDICVSAKDVLMKDANSALSAKLSANVPFGKNAFSVETADYATASNFMSVSLSAAYTMKLMEGNFVSVNAGYSYPFGATVTKVGGITMPELKLTPAGTLSFGVSDKSKVMSNMSVIVEVSGFLKADGSAAFSAGGDATGAVILAASPLVVLNKQSAIFVKPAVEYNLTDKMNVTVGTTIPTSLVNDYSSLPANVFAAVSTIF